MRTSILSVISSIIFAAAAAGDASANPPTTFENKAINIFNFGTSDPIVVNVFLSASGDNTRVSLIVLDCTLGPDACVATSAWEGELQGDVIQSNGNGRTGSAAFDTSTLFGEGIGGTVVVDCVATGGRTHVVSNGRNADSSFHFSSSLFESSCEVQLFGAPALTLGGIVLVNRGFDKFSP